VRPILFLALLAVLGLAVAGCGSAKKNAVVGKQSRGVVYVGPARGSGVQQSSTNSAIRVPGATTATIPHVKTGTRIVCKEMPGISVTAPATGASVIARTRGTKELRLKRLPDRSIRVSCTTPSEKP
jgi:hypothetical protein